MTSQPNDEGPPGDRDFDWMESTFPLHEDLIQRAIDELATRNGWVPRTRSEGAAGRPALCQADERGSLYTRVTGPVAGYFIASYACRTDDPHTAFVGAYKICEAFPSSYWDAQTLLGGTCRHSDGSGMSALASAEAQAALKISELPLLVDRR